MRWWWNIDSSLMSSSSSSMTSFDTTGEPVVSIDGWPRFVEEKPPYGRTIASIKRIPLTSSQTRLSITRGSFEALRWKAIQRRPVVASARNSSLSWLYTTVGIRCECRPFCSICLSGSLIIVYSNEHWQIDSLLKSSSDEGHSIMWYKALLDVERNESRRKK